MLRKSIMALAALLVVGATSISVPTTASARHWGGGHWHGGWHGGWGWGPRFYYAPYPAYGYYGYYGCWRTVRVFTPWGPRWRRVWVCG